MHNNKQSLANTMLQQTQSFQQEVEERKQQAAKNGEQEARTFIGKKKHPKETSKETSKTVFNFIPLPFNTDDGIRSVRLISDAFTVLYDTDIPYDTGSGTKKELYNIASIKEFKNYEQAFGVKVLSPEDEELVKTVQQKLWAIKKYFPYFDNVINANKEHLSPEFLDAHKGKLRINYFSHYMLIPAIELSEEIYSQSQGDNTSKIKRYSMLHFNKAYLIDDWNKWIEKWANKSGNNFATEFEEVFGGPDNQGNVKKYLSITISDEEPNFDGKTQQPNNQTPTNSANTPNRLTKFTPKKYIPELFASEEEGALEITPELLSKVVNLYDMDKFFRVAHFEKDVYQKLLRVLETGESWLKEEGIGKTVSATESQNIASPQAIEEDEVPF